MRYVAAVPLAMALALSTGCSKLGKDASVKDSTVKTEVKDASTAAAAEKAPPPQLSSTTRISAGRMFEAEGNMPAALEQYRAATVADPNDVEAYTRTGVACNRLQRYEEATRAFLRAIEIAPDRAYLHNNLGFCYVLQERFDDAEKSFRNAIALRPDYKRAHMNLGAVLAQTGRTDEAVQEFEIVVPRDAAFYNLGLILASNRKFDAAEQAFRHSLALNPGSRDATLQIDRLAMLKAKAAGTPPAPAVASADDASAGMALNAAPATPSAPTTQPSASESTAVVQRPLVR